jgi:hypothetical protein
MADGIEVENGKVDLNRYGIQIIEEAGFEPQIR